MAPGREGICLVGAFPPPVHGVSLVNARMREELRQFLSDAAAHEPRTFPFFLTLARAGLRPGEALALDRSDVDCVRRLLLVEKTSDYCARLDKANGLPEEPSAD